MTRIPWLWGLLFALWLLLSNHFEPLFVFFGVATCSVAVHVCARMGIVDAESVPVHLAGRAFRYLPWLVWEIFRSNVAVARIILSPRPRVDPRIVRFRASQRTELGRFVHANSITLTPGTVTTGVVGDDLEVHAIVHGDVDGTEESPMNQRVSRLEGSAG